MGKDKSGKGKHASALGLRPGWHLDPALPALADSVAEAVLVLDASGSPQLANARFRQMAGNATAGFAEGGWLGALAGQDRARAQALWLEAAEALSPREAVLGLPSGRKALCRVTPVKGTRGVMGWVVTLTCREPDEELAALRLALAEAEGRIRNEAALRRAMEERLSLAETELRASGRRAAQAEEALAEVRPQLADSDDRLRGMAAGQAIAEARLAEAETRLAARRPETSWPEDEASRTAIVPEDAVRTDGLGQGGSDAQRSPPSAEGDRVQGEGIPVEHELPEHTALCVTAEPRSPAADEEDIARLRDRLRSEDLKALLADWQAMRRHRIAPAPHAWEPDLQAGSMEVRAAEVGADGSPVRIATISIQAAGPLGRALSVSGPSEAAWRRCAGTARPIHEFACVTLGQGGPRTHERLLLPFSSDGRAVDHVLSLAVAGEVPVPPALETAGARVG